MGTGAKREDDLMEGEVMDGMMKGDNGAGKNGQGVVDGMDDKGERANEDGSGILDDDDGESMKRKRLSDEGGGGRNWSTMGDGRMPGGWAPPLKGISNTVIKDKNSGTFMGGGHNNKLTGGVREIIEVFENIQKVQEVKEPGLACLNMKRLVKFSCKNSWLD